MATFLPTMSGGDASKAAAAAAADSSKRIYSSSNKFSPGSFKSAAGKKQQSEVSGMLDMRQLGEELQRNKVQLRSGADEDNDVEFEPETQTDLVRKLLQLMKKVQKGTDADDDIDDDMDADKGQEAVAHTLDNYTEAQYDPRYTQALLPGPRIHVLPRAFVHSPHHYTLDVMHSNDMRDVLLKLNKGNWRDTMFPLPASAASAAGDGEVGNKAQLGPKSYFSPFPGQSGRSNLVDLHFHHKTLNKAISFTLPEATLTHKAFVKKYAPSNSDLPPEINAEPAPDGVVRIPIDNEVLQAYFAEELKDIDIKESPYHLDVYEIQITGRVSNFPVEFDMMLVSSSAIKEGHFNSWSIPRGLDSTAQNMVLSPGNASASAVFNKIQASGANNIVRFSDREPLYIAPAFKNGAEQPRWINRDWPDIDRSLAKLQNGNGYMIPLPHSDAWSNFDFLTWVVCYYWHAIWQETRSLNERAAPVRTDKGEKLEFNKLYDTGGGHLCTFVSKKVLDGILNERRLKFNQEKQLMRLEGLTLLLWPVKGMDGWREYERMAEDNKLVPAKTCERVNFTCDLDIQFEPLRYALRQKREQQEDSSLMSP